MRRISRSTSSVLKFTFTRSSFICTLEGLCKTIESGASGTRKEIPARGGSFHLVNPSEGVSDVTVWIGAFFTSRRTHVLGTEIRIVSPLSEKNSTEAISSNMLTSRERESGLSCSIPMSTTVPRRFPRRAGAEEDDAARTTTAKSPTLAAARFVPSLIERSDCNMQ